MIYGQPIQSPLCNSWNLPSQLLIINSSSRRLGRTKSRQLTALVLFYVLPAFAARVFFFFLCVFLPPAISKDHCALLVFLCEGGHHYFSWVPVSAVCTAVWYAQQCGLVPCGMNVQQGGMTQRTVQNAVVVGYVAIRYSSYVFVGSGNCGSVNSPYNGMLCFVAIKRYVKMFFWYKTVYHCLVAIKRCKLCLWPSAHVHRGCFAGWRCPWNNRRCTNFVGFWQWNGIFWGYLPKTVYRGCFVQQLNGIPCLKYQVELNLYTYEVV